MASENQPTAAWRRVQRRQALVAGYLIFALAVLVLPHWLEGGGSEPNLSVVQKAIVAICLLALPLSLGTTAVLNAAPR